MTARWDYKAFDDRGRFVQGRLDAASRNAALASLHEQRLTPFYLEAARTASKAAWWNIELTRRTILPLGEQSRLVQELATLSKADLPIDESLEIIALQPMLGRRARMEMTRVHEMVTSGTSLHEALDRSKLFPEYAVRLIQAGEISGTLSRTLADLATSLEKAEATRSQIVSAIMYPLFLIAAACGAVVLIASVLLPALAPLLQEQDRSIGSFLAAMLATARFTSENWREMALGSVLVLALGATAVRHPAVGRVLHSAQLVLPFVSQLVRKREVAGFTRVLSTMLKAGIPLVDAVEVAGRAQSNLCFQEALRAAREDLVKGAGLSEALAASGLFPELSLRLVSIGERTGRLESMVSRVADIYETSFHRDLGRATAMISPVLTVIVGVLVGSIMLSVIQALMSFNDMVLR